MAVYDSVVENSLLQAAADTWLQFTRGADLVLMTDADDPRAATAIAPRTHGAVAVHVYRCSDCRSQRCSRRDCVGVREGWLARRKVLHLIVAIGRDFGFLHEPNTNAARPSAARAAPRKHFVLKLDPDTVLVPPHALTLLHELQLILGVDQPYLFGMAACRVASFALCHAAGGAGYGMSRGAVAAIDAFVRREYPDFLTRVDRFTYGGEDVTVAFALKKEAGVSVINVGCLYQHSPLKYERMHAKGEDWVHWPLSTTPASFHKFEDPTELRTFFGCALYDAQGRLRPAPRALFIPLNASSTVEPQPNPPTSESWVPPCPDGWRIAIRPARAADAAQAALELIDAGLVEIGKPSVTKFSKPVAT